MRKVHGKRVFIFLIIYFEHTHFDQNVKFLSEITYIILILFFFSLFITIGFIGENTFRYFSSSCSGIAE